MAEPSGEPEPQFFCFTLGGALYTISANGVGTRINALNGREPFALRIDKGFDVDLLNYRPIGNRLYFMYQTTDGEYGGGYLDAFTMSTLRPSWLTPAGISTNLGSPLILDSAAYVTGLDIVGKVRLNDGKFVWKHIFGDIFEKLPDASRHLTAFETPVLANGKARFPQSSRISPRGDTLVIDDASGVILSPEAIKGQKPLCTGSQPSC
jgi:hypothetical protein